MTVIVQLEVLLEVIVVLQVDVIPRLEVTQLVKFLYRDSSSKHQGIVPLQVTVMVQLEVLD